MDIFRKYIALPRPFWDGAGEAVADAAARIRNKIFLASARNSGFFGVPPAGGAVFDSFRKNMCYNFPRFFCKHQERLS